eukprot:1913824-Rhodomonas_salina.1
MDPRLRTPGGTAVSWPARLGLECPEHEFAAQPIRGPPGFWNALSAGRVSNYYEGGGGSQQSCGECARIDLNREEVAITLPAARGQATSAWARSAIPQG